MLGTMRLQHQSQALFNAKNQELEAKMQAMSIHSGVPLQQVRQLAGDVPQDLPPEAYHNARRQREQQEAQATRRRQTGLGAAAVLIKAKRY